MLAKVVVDATGNADVAAAAGALRLHRRARNSPCRAPACPARKLGGTYTNTDFTITDETDLVDVWHMLVYAKHKYPQAFDQGQLVDTRERRRIVGDYTSRSSTRSRAARIPIRSAWPAAALTTRTATRSIPYLCWSIRTGKLIVNIPYRCLLPKGFEGIW